MKNLKIILISILVTCFSGDRLYAANTLINIQMGNGTAYTSDGAAVANLSQTWNKFSAAGVNTYSTIKDSAGKTVTGVSVTENMTTRGNWAASSTNFTNATDLPLMRGGLSINAGQSGYFKFQGLSSGTYDIYIYSEAQKGVPSTINMNVITSVGTYGINFSNDSTLKSLTEATSANLYNGNWIKKTVVINTAVTGQGLNNLVLNVNGTSGASMINGIQLQYVGAVPEPDSVILFGVGGVFVLGLMRIRAKDDVAVSA